jgi:hypothetical protein
MQLVHPEGVLADGSSPLEANLQLFVHAADDSFVPFSPRTLGPLVDTS